MGYVDPLHIVAYGLERQVEISDYKPRACRLNGGEQKYIIHNGKFVEINWDKVILWDEPGGLKINPGKYYDNSGKIRTEAPKFCQSLGRVSFSRVVRACIK